MTRGVIAARARDRLLRARVRLPQLRAVAPHGRDRVHPAAARRAADRELVASSLFVLAIILLAAGPIADLAGVDAHRRHSTRRAAAIVGFLIAVAGHRADDLGADVDGRLVADRRGPDRAHGPGDERDVRDRPQPDLHRDARSPPSGSRPARAELVERRGRWSVLVLGLEIQVRMVEEPYLSQPARRGVRAVPVRTTGRFVPGLGQRAGDPDAESTCRHASLAGPDVVAPRRRPLRARRRRASARRRSCNRGRTRTPTRALPPPR